MKKSILFILVTAVSLFSCKKIAEELESIGSFTSTFTGSIDKKLDGEAAFAQVINKSNPPESSSLVITLAQIDNQDEIIVFTLVSKDVNGIATGTYDYDETGTSDVLFLPAYTNGGGQTLYIVDPDFTNSVTITSVEDIRIKGEFVINVMTVGTSPEKVKITGTFDSVGSTVTK